MDVIAFSCYGERSSRSRDVLPNVKLRLCDELYTRGKYISCAESLEAFGTTHASWPLQYFGSLTSHICADIDSRTDSINFTRVLRVEISKSCALKVLGGGVGAFLET